MTKAKLISYDVDREIQRPDVPEQVIQEVAEAIEILETHSSERYAWAAINTLMELGWKPKGKGR